MYLPGNSHKYCDNADFSLRQKLKGTDNTVKRTDDPMNVPGTLSSSH